LKSLNSPSSNLSEPLKKLYIEIGSEARLTELLAKFYKKMSSDLMLGFFFLGHDLDHIIQMQKMFLLRAMGINKKYEGKSPRAAHRKIPPILKGHFDRRMVLLRETLKEEGLSEKNIQTWVNFEEQFRKSIVEKEAPLTQRRPK
jgi:truncated hemoglobin YjbI